MHKLTTAALVALALAGSPALAQSGRHSHGSGPAHSHDPVNKAEAQAGARDVIATMISKKIVDASWKDAALQTAELKTRGRSREWVVTFRNDTAADPAKRVLYVFLTETGDYIAANHTGR
jgi:Family of unknown function (DUF6488)